MRLHLKISKTESGRFEVDSVPMRPGSPAVGRGRTMREAIGDFFHANQRDLEIVFDVDKSAWPSELRRRRYELSKR